MPKVTGPNDIKPTQSIAFPFSAGALSFPKMTDNDVGSVFSSMASLILTGKTERVMHNDLGSNAHAFVFDSMGPLTRARIAAELSRVIAEYEPRAEILSIDTVDGKDGKLSDTTIIVNVVWRLNGEVNSQQIPVASSSTG